MIKNNRNNSPPSTQRAQKREKSRHEFSQMSRILREEIKRCFRVKEKSRHELTQMARILREDIFWVRDIREGIVGVEIPAKNMRE